MLKNTNIYLLENNYKPLFYLGKIFIDSKTNIDMRRYKKPVRILENPKRRKTPIKTSLKSTEKGSIPRGKMVRKNLRDSIKLGRKRFMRNVPRLMYCEKVVISDILERAIQQWEKAKSTVAKQETASKRAGVSAGAAPRNNPFPYFIVELTGLVTKKMGFGKAVNQSLARNLRLQSLEERGVGSFDREKVSPLVENALNQIDQLGPEGVLLGSTLRLEWGKIKKHPNSSPGTVHVADPNFFGFLKAVNITHLAKVVITPREFQELDYTLNTIVEKVTKVPMDWHFL